MKNEQAMVVIAPLMKQMADGNSEALFELLEHFHDDLERVVGGILVSIQRRDLARSSDEVRSMAVSAAFVVFARATGWKPDGALPWVWAYRSIREEIVRQVGHPSVELDPARVETPHPPAPKADDRAIDLRDLAQRHDEVAGWLDAVEAAASRRDREVHLEYQVQKHLGDPSPANTVGSMFELTPANVRQIDRRVRTRLQASDALPPRVAAGLGV